MFEDVIVVDWGLGAGASPDVINNAYQSGTAIARFLDNLYNATLIRYSDVALVKITF